MKLPEILTSLPEHLQERTRWHNAETAVDLDPANGFVLYWMATAVRCDENPALDVAKHIAVQQRLPLLVYHAISQHYRFASDRHHTFMLQGARDVETQMAEIRISYAFHLATRDDHRPHLIDLANESSVVVTEDMPVDPPRRFLNSLTNATKAPVICVDTACVVPMKLVGKAYTRAFKFRSATKKLYEQRLPESWPKQNAVPQQFDFKNLPFEPINLQTADLADLVSRCEIDHAIAPVVDSAGGSTAGYARWNQFKTEKLSSYAKQRNNALLDGVSRMSPYLHYGMVSPFRIAREAAEAGNAGSEKYLDELLIWRELAYEFCFFRDDHDQWSAIPDWARETLERHREDARTGTYSDEQLARAQTNDDFWNASQKSLLIQGELHNNVRMTWGKAILKWKHSPQEALRTIIDLNHRYALDGRDPASYGGILWCLGQFDRPFEPEQNVIGTVRPRPTSQHANRLDTKRFLARSTTARFQPIRVAVIGAGISGLFAARTLLDHGVEVAVFDKGRGVGGRMSTRSIGDRAGAHTFDHGAQYFTARDSRFKRYVESWVEQGIVAKWPDERFGSDQRIVVLKDGAIQSESQSEARYVGVPGMSAICKHLSSGIDVKTKIEVSKINSTDSGVELFCNSQVSLGHFDRLIVSAPAAQSAALLANFPELAAEVSETKMNPCWATMVAFDSPITDRWVGAFLHGSFLSWAARNNTKPGRDPNADHVTIHASPDWTVEHWDDDPADVAAMMLSEFWTVTGISPLPHTHLNSHRWKYAIPVEPSASQFLADDSSTVIACGDWANGSRVEGAFISGMSAAGGVLRRLKPLPDASAKQTLLF